MSIGLMPGSRLPAYCTSMGRVLLAALPEIAAAEILSHTSLPARTPRTLTDPRALVAEFARVRSQGYAIVDQEVEVGLRSIAIPLYNSRGQTVAAMNVGVAASRTEAEDMTRLYLPAMIGVQAELRKLMR